jgi:ABC-type Na+ efflux pump permease subunit
MSKFEVVRSDVDGWDVRRVGEAQALSNYETRELAEEAARRQQDAEDRSGSDADAIDVRQDVFSEGPEEDLDAKKTFLGMSAVMIGVILLIIVIGAIVAITGLGS